MQLKKIEYFIEIIECGSLSKAAEKLFLSQSTLSRYLEKLEDEAGIALFIRKKNNHLELTEFGKTYYKRALEINTIWKKLNGELTEYIDDTMQNRNISIGFSLENMADLLEPSIKELKAKYPNVTITLIPDYAVNLKTNIVEGRLDFAVSAISEKTNDLVYVDRESIEIELVTSKEHPLAQYAYDLPGQQDLKISINDIDPDTQFAIPHNTSILYRDIKNYLKKMNFPLHISRGYIGVSSVEKVIKGKNSLVGFCPQNYTTADVAHIALDPPFYYRRAIYYRKDRVMTSLDYMVLSMLKKLPTPTRKNSP